MSIQALGEKTHGNITVWSPKLHEPIISSPFRTYIYTLSPAQERPPLFPQFLHRAGHALQHLWQGTQGRRGAVRGMRRGNGVAGTEAAQHLGVRFRR